MRGSSGAYWPPRVTNPLVMKWECLSLMDSSIPDPKATVEDEARRSLLAK